ncbi:MAG: FAD-dependent oxidoreductase [Actinomycetota bacterium]|jgi:NADH dehydrogenase FAD-containing subunit|nr:FAD-dependent oxidoreductase [Actinomycetota bacterium]
MSKPRVVIVGTGLGGLAAARRLRGAEVEVAIIDRHHHHLFQPLLYEVATAILSPCQIAPPIRSIRRDRREATAMVGDVYSIGIDRSSMVLAAADGS